MGGIRIEEAAAVGAQMLDGLERSHWTQRNRLFRAFHRVRNNVGRKRLRLALLDHEQRQYDRDGHQNARCEAGQVPVEIPEIGTPVLDREGAYERHCDNEAGARRGEHREGDCRHLAEVR